MTEPTSTCSNSLWRDTWTDEDNREALKLRGPIWIVGASGFIGSKLTASLLKLRSDVVAVSSNVNTSWRLLHLKSVKKLQIDITNYEETLSAIRTHKPQTVFNLSAYGAYERQSDPIKIHKVNYTGTLNLISALSEMSCAAFVQAGSSSEYGKNCAGPDEDDDLLPNSDYAASKVAASELLRYYARHRQFPCAHLRLYSIYGPWEERDRLLPKLITAGLAGSIPPMAAEEISRDFVYIDDCTRAFVRAAMTTCVTRPGSTYNIATGESTTLGQIARLSKAFFNLSVIPEFGTMPNRRWDLQNWFGKPDKAAQELGWKSRVPLNEGFKMMAEWELAAQETVLTQTPATTPHKISAVIACYKDWQAIPQMHERLIAAFDEIGCDYEIIFVNDCSPEQDEIAILAASEKDPKVIGISHSRNFGSQNAFLSGMKISSGDAVVLMDGDLQDPPEIIPEMYRKWSTGFDVVYGERIAREAPIHMQFLYKAFYRIFRHLSSVPIPLDAGDFSMMDRKVVNQLLALPESDIFIRGLRAWVGFKQTGIAYKRPERAFGVTTNSFLKNIWWAKKAIFSFSIKPLNYLQGLAISICALSFLLSIFYLIHHIIYPNPSAPGFTTVILVTLCLGGVQLLGISILGDYVGKTLEESKRRPHFIRNRILKNGKIHQSQKEMNWVLRSSENPVADLKS